jgi:hypothetical protein
MYWEEFFNAGGGGKRAPKQRSQLSKLKYVRGGETKFAKVGVL